MGKSNAGKGKNTGKKPEIFVEKDDEGKGTTKDGRGEEPTTEKPKYVFTEEELEKIRAANPDLVITKKETETPKKPDGPGDGGKKDEGDGKKPEEKKSGEEKVITTVKTTPPPPPQKPYVPRAERFPWRNLIIGVLAVLILALAGLAAYHIIKGRLDGKKPAPPVVATQTAPVVAINDQSVTKGTPFALFGIDNAVTDDSPDSEIKWSVSGNANLSVGINENRMVVVSPINTEWVGTEAITFTATDPGGLPGSDTATFTITAAPVVSEPGGGGPGTSGGTTEKTEAQLDDEFWKIMGEIDKTTGAKHSDKASQ